MIAGVINFCLFRCSGSGVAMLFFAELILFQLPIEHKGKTAGYWSLPKE